MVSKLYSLTGRTGLITGAAGLLGLEHAAALVEADMQVVLTDISISQLEKAKQRLSAEFRDPQVILQVMDVSNMASIQGVHEALAKDGVHVDVLINNAAIDPKVTREDGIAEASRLENFSRDMWDAQIAVGLTGALQCSQVFGKQMADRGNGGVILNIASDLSVFAPDQRLYRVEGLSEEMQPVKPVTYSVIKAGLIGLTRYLATYWAEKGVRSNALSPGGIYVDQNEEFVHRLSSLIPLGRMAEQDEYRAAVQFLCSDASKYMNGQNIVMDGGRSAL